MKRTLLAVLVASLVPLAVACGSSRPDATKTTLFPDDGSGGTSTTRKATSTTTSTEIPKGTTTTVKLPRAATAPPTTRARAHAKKHAAKPHAKK